MGIRGELFSARTSCEGRTYFFNVKENRMGDMFLTVVESKPTESDSFDRRSIVVFRDDLPAFLKALQEALGYMEKDGEAPRAPTFSPRPGEPAPARRRAAPAGFAGAEGSTEARPAGAGEAPVRKRKVLVKRKGTGGESPSA